MELIPRIKERPIRLIGASGKVWALGGEIIISRPPNKDQVVPECPPELYKEEFISIGYGDLFTKPVEIHEETTEVVDKDEKADKPKRPRIKKS